MNKTILSLAVLLAASGAASAQSGVTLYGRIDLGMVLDSGNAAGKSLRLSSGAASASRLGFRGVEDLGGGNKAGFLLETGLCADSATVPTAGNPSNNGYCTGGGFMGRQANGTLSGNWGTLTGGRQYTLGFDDLILVDPFNTGYAGRVNNIVDSSGTRLNNSARYTTPLMAGWRAAGEFALGEVTGNVRAGREFGGALQYVSGPAYGSLMVFDQKNANGQGDLRRNVQLGGSYDFGVVKAFALVQKGSGRPTGAPAAIDTLDLMGGINVPVAGGRLMMSYVHHDDRGPLDRDAGQIAAGYNYPLSKRTSVYTAFSRIGNRHGASFIVGNSTEAGTGTKALNLGVLHMF